VRVNGDIDQAALDALTAMVRAHIDSRCHDDGPFEMPKVAQQMHGRRTYRCGREKGHSGEHRWPDKPDAKWTWVAATPSAPEPEPGPSVASEAAVSVADGRQG
jgi:hypothetical protein